jgi:hypothetical protein
MREDTTPLSEGTMDPHIQSYATNISPQLQSKSSLAASSHDASVPRALRWPFQGFQTGRDRPNPATFAHTSDGKQDYDANSW